MDDAAWAALTLSLTVAGSIWTWVAFRRRGLASGLRALAFTLLPVAAYLTKTLQMFTGIVGEITHWAGNLVWNPFVWAGVLLGGVVRRAVRAFPACSARASSVRPTRPKPLPPGKAPKSEPALGTDDDMAEIEALLRKRGISMSKTDHVERNRLWSRLGTPWRSRARRCRRRCSWSISTPSTPTRPTWSAGPAASRSGSRRSRCASPR